MFPCRPLATLAIVCVLSACTKAAPVVGLIENNNYKTGGRSVTGWAMSQLENADCEPMRVFESQPVCRPSADPVGMTVYCYRTLAAVTCHEQPDRTMPPNRHLPPPRQ
ncbi:MAG: hypothetical protein FJX57_02795 [Alphaproteobacteria bacterium]|nr:hypothetical protein [Alphaproteobacteria bacterium]